MSAPRVVIFCFAGRRGNMELQVPLVRRLLEEHPGAEYDVWNLSGNPEDDAYLRTITGERITVRDNPHTRGGPQAFKRVYRHYNQPEYEGALFVKLDDDIVFLQTARFGVFLSAIAAHPGVVVSANTVNNGACAPLQPALWEAFKGLGIPLLDVHKSNRYAEIAHGWFGEHWAEMLAEPVELVPTEDWLSINAIGYDWGVAREIAARLGSVPHPEWIAGRHFAAPWGIMDEGMVNLLPRILMRGFVVAHLTFGPQGCTGDQCDRWRAGYAQIGERYLAEAVPTEEGPLPGLSPVSARQGTPRERNAPRPVENDPRVGRFIA